MNLSEQQKQIGKENFADVVAITRRDFLGGAVAAGLATGAGLGSIYFGYGKSVGDPLRVGVLGCGQIAQAAHFEACRKARNAELHAICDAAPDLLARMAEVHRPAAAYADYDAMLADPDVDAVIVAVAVDRSPSLSASVYVKLVTPLKFAVGVNVNEPLLATVTAPFAGPLSRLHTPAPPSPPTVSLPARLPLSTASSFTLKLSATAVG